MSEETLGSQMIDNIRHRMELGMLTTSEAYNMLGLTPPIHYDTRCQMPNQVEYIWQHGDIENRMQKVISSKCRRDIDLDKKLSVLRRNGSTIREMFKVVRYDKN